MGSRVSQMPDDWQRIQTIFRKAIDVSPDQREEFVDEACGDDLQLRAEIESLLDSFDPSEEELEESPILAFEPPPEESPEELRASREDSIPGYKILEEIHRGGQGIVYRAIQQSTKREVALKFMLTGPLVGDDTKRRFEREVELVGKLRHPGIVRVYDSGLARDQYYYVMDLIHGARLDEYVHENNLSLTELITLYTKVCEAVNHAHQHGVIHRDLKPSNILVDPEGQPHVLDFGLAKLRDRSLEDTISVTGQVMGTLAYMSPEQAAGKTELVDTRSDVYSLGVVLYELLTDRLPYNVEDSFHEGLSAIKNHQPNRLHLRQSRIGNEVSTIVFKALSKEMDRRYQVAGALGEDLGRYLRGDPIEAKRDSAFYVLRKTIRRHWAAAIAAAAFLLLLLLSSVVSTALYLEADRERYRADATAMANGAQRDAMALMRDESIEQLYFAEMNLAAEALGQSGGIFRVKEIASHWVGNKSREQLRGWEWYYLSSRCDREFKILEHPREVWCAQWHPRENRVAFGDYGGRVWIWDLESPPSPVGKVGLLVRGIAWNHDGSRLAAVSTRGGLKVWDAESRNEIFAHDQSEDLLAVAWHPTKPSQLVFSSGIGLVELWDVDTATKLDESDFPRGVQTVDWDEEGNRLILACHDQFIRTVNFGDEKKVRKSGQLGGPVFNAAIEPNGSRTLSSTSQGHLSIRGYPTGKSFWSIQLPRPSWALAWDGTGQRFASAGADRTLRIWGVTKDDRQCDTIERFDGHLGEIWGLDWNHDDSMIATASRDKTVRVWKPNAPGGDLTLMTPYRPGHHNLTGIAWSPDGRTIALGTVDMKLRLWDPESGSESHQLLHDGKIDSLDWSHDGRRIVTGATDEKCVVWDVPTESVVCTFEGHRGPKVNAPTNALHAARWSPDDKWIASTSHDGAIFLWDAETGKVVAQYKDSSIPFDLVWHPVEQSLIYVGSRSEEVKFWNLNDEDPPKTVYRCPTIIHALDWSPDGNTIAVARQDGWIDLLDARTWEPLHSLRDHVDTVEDLEFSPNGQRLVSGSLDGTLRLWDVNRGVQAMVIPSGISAVAGVAWSPDNRQIAYLGGSGAVRVMNASRSYEREQCSEPVLTPEE